MPFGRTDGVQYRAVPHSVASRNVNRASLDSPPGRLHGDVLSPFSAAPLPG